jgi:hypothetical protein
MGLTKYLISGSIIFFFLVSCRKDHETPLPTPTPQSTEMELNLAYNVDGNPFITNSLVYLNTAGNTYSITKLVYFLSQISLIKADSSIVLLKDYSYVDASIAATNQWSFKDMPAGNYIGIKFNIGLDSLHNISDTLANTIDNINMKWPDMMGGGYHFMKLEGYFKDSTGTSYGYNMHLGTNISLVPIRLFKNISITANAMNPLNLKMNINEWFRNPHTYNFNTDGNYIMGNAILMKKIADNGVDVFSF